MSIFLIIVVCPNFGHPVQNSDIYLSSNNLKFCRGKIICSEKFVIDC